MNGKTILMAVKNNFVADNRVFRAANTLQEQGFNVTLLAYHREGLKEDETLGSGFRVLRLKTGKSRPGRNFIFNIFRYFIFKRKTKHAARRIKPAIVHCHDYNTLFIGFFCRKKFGSRIIYDNHEYFQDLKYLHRYPGILRYLIAMYERRAIRKVDEMIVVSPGIARAYQNIRGKAGKEIHVIRNIPDTRTLFLHTSINKIKEGIDARILRLLDKQKEQGKKLLLYLGTNTARGRGIDFTFQLLGRLPGDYGFVIFGARSEQEIRQARQKAEALNISDRFDIFPPLKIEQLLSLADYFYFGISLIEPIYFSYKHSLPNKFFEYIAMGLPILSSDIPDQGELIRQFRNGLVIPLDNITEAAARIKGYSPDPTGISKARASLTWENEKLKLLEIYRQL
jgi:glycosyltransferase involved in cell wall biosynthesis